MAVPSSRDELLMTVREDGHGGGGVWQSQPLGAALLIIHGCRYDALVKAVRKLQVGQAAEATGAAVRQAIDTVLWHAGVNGGGAAATAAVVGSLLEANGRHWYQKAALIIAVLLFSKSLLGAGAVAQHAADALCKLWADGANKKLKLRCVRVLRVLHNVSTDTTMNARADHAAILSVVQCVLADLLRLHHNQYPGGSPSNPTRLMVETADCILVWCECLHSTSGDDDTTAFGLDATRDIAMLTSEWYSDHHRLFAAAAAGVAEVARGCKCGTAIGHELIRETVPLLLCRPAAAVLRGQAARRATSAIQHTDAQRAKIDDHANSSRDAAIPFERLLWVCTIGLAVGRDDPATAMNLLADAGCGLTELLGFAAHPALTQLVCTHRIAAAVLRTAMGTALTGAASSVEMSDVHLECLFSLARAGGAMAEACTGVLVDLVKAHPDLVLGRVFSVFDKAPADEQLNVLTVLGGMTIEGVICELRPQLRSQLSAALLSRLHDTDVTVRNLAASVLGRLDPEHSAAVLCNQLVDRDDRHRSAAERTLVTMLASATDPTVVLQILLAQCTSSQRDAPPSHPGQVGRSTQGAPDDGASQNDVDQRRERILHVVERWVDREMDLVGNAAVVKSDLQHGEKRWEEVVAPFVINLVLTRPEDTARVQLATRMAPRLGQPDCIGAVLSMVNDVLEAQSVLTAEALNGDATGALTKLLLFQRLSPLLLLRMLPTDAFSDPKMQFSFAPIQHALLDRVSTNLEFDDVRRVSAELFSRGAVGDVFPLLLKVLHSEVNALSAIQSRHDPSVAKGTIYSLCCGVAQQSRREHAMQALLPWTAVILDDCLRVFRLDSAELGGVAPEDALHKLQRGCIDLLGVLLAVEAGGEASRTPSRSTVSRKIVELSDSETIDEDAATTVGSDEAATRRDTSVLDGLLAVLRVGTIGPAPVCAANALFAADRHIRHLCAEDATVAVPIHAALLRRSASTMLAIVAGEIGGSIRARAACAQALFSLAFRLQNNDTFDEYREELIEVAIAALSEDVTPLSGPLRLGAIKLIGAVLGRAVTVSVSSGDVAPGVDMPGTGLARLHAVLVGLANMDPDQEVQSIATNLLRALGNPGQS